MMAMDIVELAGKSVKLSRWRLFQGIEFPEFN
jgi:hypothetical protein